MDDAFFEGRGLIPAGHVPEVGLERLEADPSGEVGRIDEAPGVPDIGHVEPVLRRYVASLGGSRKDASAPLTDALRRRLTAERRACFEEWSYPEQAD